MSEFKIFGDAHFAFRSDTLENWKNQNPVLESGEPGVVTGLKETGDGLCPESERVKWGDGVTPWNDLPWWKGPQGEKGEDGAAGPQGEKGDSYILNDADKKEIAGMVEVPEVDLTDYVKNTDYPTSDGTRTGVVKLRGYGAGGIDVEQDGTLCIRPASVALINQREFSRPITGHNLDYAVKVGLTTNSETLTEEEKASACEWVGAVGQKDFTTNKTFEGSAGGCVASVYVVNHNGEQTIMPVYTQKNNWTIPCRDSNGNFYIGEPKIDYHAATKSYVDNGLTALAIPNTVECGGKSISVNDVTPFVHNCSCRLTSDTYDEAQSTGESNNIYDFNADNMSIGMYRQDGVPSPVPYVINDNGTITFNGNTEPSGLAVGIKFIFDNLIKGQTYTFSLRSNQDERFWADVCTANDWSSSIWDYDIASNNSSVLTVTFTATDVDGRHWCDISCCGAREYDSEGTPIVRPIENLILYPQLEFGSEMTDWAPYGGGEVIVITKPYVEDFSTVKVNVGGKSYTPKADGTVTGIVSTSPTMEVTTDNEHVNIHDFSYCVDTKKYIEKNTPNAYELVEEITVTEAGNVERNATPSGEAYSSLYKNMLVTIYNQEDKGCAYCYIYRKGNEICLTSTAATAGEFLIAKSEVIAPELSEWSAIRKGSNEYGNTVIAGCVATSNNISRVLIAGTTAGTVIKIYGAKA